ncbi:MAG: hypothetical protein ACM3PY_16835 [Omnitrophica WOR_2 bacterium]
MKTDMPPQYPFPWKVLSRLVFAILTQNRLPFQAEARRAAALLPEPIQVYGKENIPAHGPCVLTINHYTRPGFSSWWQVLSVSSVVPAPIRWITAEAWTGPDWLYTHTVTPATFWAFRQMERTYNFFSMPPMPPRPQDLERRANAVRQVLKYASRNPQAMIGMAPEGQDEYQGVLQWPPEGTGRFLLHLAKAGLQLIPIGIFEEEDCLCLHFGQAYSLSVSPGLPVFETDLQARRSVMEHIAAVLPESLRGEFGKEDSRRL